MSFFQVEVGHRGSCLRARVLQKGLQPREVYSIGNPDSAGPFLAEDRCVAVAICSLIR